MRRQLCEALRDLQEAEQIAPELTRTHRLARDVARGPAPTFRAAPEARATRASRTLRHTAMTLLNGPHYVGIRFQQVGVSLQPFLHIGPFPPFRKPPFGANAIEDIY